MMNSYFRFLLVLTVSLMIFFPTFALAQSDDETHSLSENSKALKFQIAENFRLTSFDGSAFSYKRHSSESHALRIGLSFGNNYRKESFERDFENQQSDFTSDITLINLGASVSLARIRYIEPEADIKFYFGYGPELDVGYRLTKNESDDNSKSSMSRRNIGLSAVGLTGVEWFFHRSISIHAEYQAYLRTGYYKEISENDQLSQSSKSWVAGINSGGVKFGISAYF